MTPGSYYMQAIELARRGFAVLIVMRRGYGSSGGELAEANGPCGNRDQAQRASREARQRGGDGFAIYAVNDELESERTRPR